MLKKGRRIENFMVWGLEDMDPREIAIITGGVITDGTHSNHGTSSSNMSPLLVIMGSMAIFTILALLNRAWSLQKSYASIYKTCHEWAKNAILPGGEQKEAIMKFFNQISSSQNKELKPLKAFIEHHVANYPLLEGASCPTDAEVSLYKNFQVKNVTESRSDPASQAHALFEHMRIAYSWPQTAFSGATIGLGVGIVTTVVMHKKSA